MRHELIEATPLQRAVEAAGSQALLGEALGCSQQYIWQCLKRGWVNLDMATKIEALYGIKRIDLISADLRKALENFVTGEELPPVPSGAVSGRRKRDKN